MLREVPVSKAVAVFRIRIVRFDVGTCEIGQRIVCEERALVLLRECPAAVIVGNDIVDSTIDVGISLEQLSLGTLEQKLGAGELTTDNVSIADTSHLISILEGLSNLRRSKSIVLVAAVEGHTCHIARRANIPAPVRTKMIHDVAQSARSLGITTANAAAPLCGIGCHEHDVVIQAGILPNVGIVI